MILFFNLPLILTFHFHIKKPDADLFLGRPNDKLFFTDIATADTFSLEDISPLQNLIIVTSKDNHVFDVARNPQEIIYWPKHGGTNQRFSIYFRQNDKIKILYNSNKCLSYNSNNSKIMVEPCIDDILQEFVIVPIKEETFSDTVPVGRAKLEAMKRAAMACDEIKEEMGAEAIAELGETNEETVNRLSYGGLL